jgi:hypothetical protein
MLTPCHGLLQRQSCSPGRTGCWLSRSASRELTGQEPYPVGLGLWHVADPDDGYRSAATVASPRESSGGTRVTPPSAGVAVGAGVGEGAGVGVGWAVGDGDGAGVAVGGAVVSGSGGAVARASPPDEPQAASRSAVRAAAGR